MEGGNGGLKVEGGRWRAEGGGWKGGGWKGGGWRGWRVEGWRASRVEGGEGGEG